MPRHQKVLPVSPAQSVQINAHPNRTVPIMDCQTRQLAEQSGQRLYIPGDETCSMGPPTPTGGNLGQQAPAQIPCSQGLLRMQANAGTMEARYTPHFIHIGGGCFGVKYTNKADINHLIECLKEDYNLTQDRDGDLYCGIKLKWNYNEGTLDISVPGYII